MLKIWEMSMNIIHTEIKNILPRASIVWLFYDHSFSFDQWAMNGARTHHPSILFLSILFSVLFYVYFSQIPPDAESALYNYQNTEWRWVNSSIVNDPIFDHIHLIILKCIARFYSYNFIIILLNL